MQVEALVDVAAQCVEQSQLLRGFHAFGYHSEPQIVSQRDNPSHQCGASFGPRLEVLDEGAIDLDAVYGKSLEMAKRRVARAESSIAKRTPSRRSSSICSTTPIRLSMSAVSVISSSNRERGSPHSSNMRSTRAVNLPSVNCKADTFTATSGTSYPSRSQRAALRQAVRVTHSPIDNISPVSSAIGINSAGDTCSGRTGCCEYSAFRFSLR
jgi:hypothetical protein